MEIIFPYSLEEVVTAMIIRIFCIKILQKYIRWINSKILAFAVAKLDSATEQQPTTPLFYLRENLGQPSGVSPSFNQGIRHCDWLWRVKMTQTADASLTSPWGMGSTAIGTLERPAGRELEPG